MSKVNSSQKLIESRRKHFARACVYFGLEPEYVTKILLDASPATWADSFAGGIRGGRAASSLSVILARIKCAEGDHNTEYQLCYGAAKHVITDEAASYRDAWVSLLSAMDHCYRELPNNKQKEYEDTK